MSFESVAMRSPQIGSKRQCVSCAARFYDMTKAPPVCPKCGTVQPPEVVRVRSPAREPRRPFKMQAPVRAEVEEDVAPAEVAENEDDEDAVEPADADDEEDGVPGLADHLAHTP